MQNTTGKCQETCPGHAREMTKQIDLWAKQPSKVACISKDLKDGGAWCWGAWDTTCGHRAKDITVYIISQLEDRGVERSCALWHTLKGSDRPLSVRWTLKLPEYVLFEDVPLVEFMEFESYRRPLWSLWHHSSAVYLPCVLILTLELFQRQRLGKLLWDEMEYIWYGLFWAHRHLKLNWMLYSFLLFSPHSVCSKRFRRKMRQRDILLLPACCWSTWKWNLGSLMPWWKPWTLRN